jgi:hypothetical protein
VYCFSALGVREIAHLFGLPYLAFERISDCFVNNFMAKLPNLNSFSKMADDLVDNYSGEASTFPPSLWSSKSSHLYLTTNPCESFHSHFAKSFYHTHSNINIFVKTLLEYQCFIYIKNQSIRTQIIVKTKKVKEAEKFVSENI